MAPVWLSHQKELGLNLSVVISVVETKSFQRLEIWAKQT
jgi:hypothetical protein